MLHCGTGDAVGDGLGDFVGVGVGDAVGDGLGDAVANAKDRLQAIGAVVATSAAFGLLDGTFGATDCDLV